MYLRSYILEKIFNQIDCSRNLHKPNFKMHSITLTIIIHPSLMNIENTKLFFTLQQK